jgi:hypothetical protein
VLTILKSEDLLLGEAFGIVGQEEEEGKGKAERGEETEEEKGERG